MEKSNKFKLFIGLVYLILISLFLFFFFSKFSFQELTSYDFIRENKLYFSEIFSVDETSMLAPKLIRARPTINNKRTEMVIRKLMLKLNSLHLLRQFQNLLLILRHEP